MGVTTDKMHEAIAPPAWAEAWVDRSSTPMQHYISAVFIGLGCYLLALSITTCFRCWRAGKELEANPSNRAQIHKKIGKTLLKRDCGMLKVALAYMANTFIVMLVDGCIAAFVLFTDVQDNPEVWDQQMYISVGLYVIYLCVLFVASFCFVPMLQMYAVTWILTRFSKSHNLADYVPSARGASACFAMLWAMASWYTVSAWPIVGGHADQTATRFFALEASWGSALGWLEAATLFCYFSHALEDRELTGKSRVNQIVASFARGAVCVLNVNKGDGSLPRYEVVAQEEVLSEKN